MYLSRCMGPQLLATNLQWPWGPFIHKTYCSSILQGMETEVLDTLTASRSFYKNTAIPPAILPCFYRTVPCKDIHAQLPLKQFSSLLVSLLKWLYIYLGYLLVTPQSCLKCACSSTTKPETDAYCSLTWLY